jgi:hypothetical protein
MTRRFTHGPSSDVGGGYTKNNVARCWTNETAILVGEHLAEDLPPNLYQEYYQPHNKLNRTTLSKKPLDNYNTKARIDEIRVTCMEYLRHLAHTPGEGMTCVFCLNPKPLEGGRGGWHCQEVMRMLWTHGL